MGKLAVTYKEVDKLNPAEYNPRTITDEAMDRLKQSIKNFGFVDPIIINKKTGKIVGGHQRLRAAKELEIKEVPTVEINITPAKEKALNVMLNNPSAMGDYDMPMLKDLIEELDTGDLDLTLTGFSLEEIERLLTEYHVEDMEEDEVPDLPESSDIKLGDVYLLGKHRLICGDATREEHIQKLMGGNAADMVFTDPPYNVDYEGYTKDKLKLKQDNMSKAEFHDFLLRSFNALADVIKPSASLYVCHASSEQISFEVALRESGFEVRNQIIWAKNTFAWGFGRYKYQHEPIFYAHLEKQKDVWFGDKKQSTIWEVPKPAANKKHPTIKPLSLINRAIQNSSKAGDIILDTFGGSGSTLIAAHRTGRICYMAELDPKYCEVTIERWEKATGHKATLL